VSADKGRSEGVADALAAVEYSAAVVVVGYPAGEVVVTARYPDAVAVVAVRYSAVVVVMGYLGDVVVVVASDAVCDIATFAFNAGTVDGAAVVA
jgi:hypothetical protein